MKKKNAVSKKETVPSPQSPVHTTPDVLKQIPRVELFPDPDQPRKNFSLESLNELAASIQENGIIQPLIVRLAKAKYKLREPDLHSTEYHVEERLPDGSWCHAFQAKAKTQCVAFAGKDNLLDRWVIIAGERRWRAAALAGLATVPCLVRDVDAHQRFVQQFIENSQRENLTALEEAEALSKQLEQGKPHLTVDALAQQLGMSRAGLYGRLVLTRLHPPVRAALVAGKISASLAGVVAIVPEPKQQEKLLEHITNENHWQYPFSVRDVQELVEEDYCQQLGKPFKTTDEFAWTKDYPAGVTFPGSGPDSRIMTCEECPNRSGNMAAQFPELAKRPNVCTLPHCFHLKCKAHWLAAADRAKTAGKTVLTPGEFRKVKGDYLAAEKDGYLFEGHYNESPKEVLGKHAPEPVLVATKDGLEKFYKREDVATAAKAARVKIKTESYRGQTAETPEQKKARELKEKTQEQLRDGREALVIELAPALAAALAKVGTKEAWQLLKPVVGAQNWEKLPLTIQKASKTDQSFVLAGLLFNDQNGYGNMTDYHTGNWNPDMLALCKRIGVDLEAEEKKQEPALPLAKAGAKQGELLAVKKNRKKTSRKGAKAQKY